MNLQNKIIEAIFLEIQEILEGSALNEQAFDRTSRLLQKKRLPYAGLVEQAEEGEPVILVAFFIGNLADEVSKADRTNYKTWRVRVWSVTEVD